MALRLLASGRDADVFIVDDDRVLRRYKCDVNAAGEKTAMARLHRLGYPVPMVYSARQRDLIMERLYGPTLLEAIAAGTVELAWAGALLAELHDKLHALPPPSPTDPTARVLHMDLHPGNVVLTSKGPIVIDWRNSRAGLPGVDTALTALILAEVAAGEDELAEQASALLGAYLAALAVSPKPHVAAAVAFRTADRKLTPTERGRMSAAVALLRRSLAPAARQA